MAFHFHKDRDLYFTHQKVNTEKYVIPFIEEAFPMSPGLNVLEVGCAEGGVLKAFVDQGMNGYGVELKANKYDQACENLADEIESGRVEILKKDIYEAVFRNEFENSFDVIVLKDVIEHIHDQEKLLKELRGYLKANGVIFFGFPPWYMPFGGHQQTCKNRSLSVLPYYHLLPNFLYKALLRSGGESDQKIENLMEIKETGISLERFERIAKDTEYNIINKQLYLINPIYAYKFNMKPKKQLKLFEKLPFFRDFVTTCGYYVIRPE